MAGNTHRFSGENQDIQDIAQWYRMNVNAIEQYRRNIISAVRTESHVPEEFIGMTVDEVNEHLSILTKEIETSFNLSAIAAIEAKFRMDYIVRSTDKLKDDLSRDFREIYKEKGIRVGLEDDILDRWKKHYSEHKQLISTYIQSVNYRHWLAHGRYWVPKFGRNYDFTIIYVLCDDIKNSIPFKS
ncbi:hypothetical protein [Bacillus sp. T33-2]|uniref:hypothetical protein n=1 Tax=Bacillus sp. T33-2 TaxID=2054168 RepID=UPI000C76353F|nr:hypothetical protein [Bacillus sp. T33-2]PLR90901.1 hypothetical protein CVD19_22170 [Bacillus sp. T33-2]